MNRKKIVLSGIVLALGSSHYVAADTATNVQPVKSPQQIESELQQAQHDFEIAQKMFIPYYTGPLITGSASNVPPGNLEFQQYLFLTVDHAQYNGHRKSIDVPNTYVVNPLALLQTGITKWWDINTIPQGYFRWNRGHYGANFADLPVLFGFQLATETPYRPKIRLLIGEIFPTGKYKHLSPSKNGLDSTGAGAYQTSIGLNTSKVFWWSKLHPFAMRLALSYNIPNNKASARDFNAYGGGYGTKGKVAVGNSYSADLGMELSLTQKWVLANDIVYTQSDKSTFRGTPGVTAEGLPAVNGSPSSDQLSLAPAIEYNVTENGGFIGGLWFTVTGRNSANFLSLVLSYTQVF